MKFRILLLFLMTISVLSGINTFQVHTKTITENNVDSNQITQIQDFSKQSVKLETSNITIISQSNDTIMPDLTAITPIVHAMDRDVIDGTYLTTSNDPVQGGRIIEDLYKSNSFIGTFVFPISDIGKYELTFDYSYLSAGSYLWQLNFTSAQHGSWVFQIDVEVKRISFHVVMDAQPELIQNQEYYIAVNATYVINDTTLGLDSLSSKVGHPVEDLNMNIFIAYQTLDGTSITLTIQTSTNVDGFAAITLSRTATQHISKIISILLEIPETPYSNSLSYQYPLTVTVHDATKNTLVSNNTALLLITSLVGISSTLVYLHYFKQKPLFIGTLTGKRAGIVHELFRSQSLLYYQLIGQNRIEDPDIKKAIINAVPTELSEYKFLLNPIRLSIVKMLFDNLKLTSVELKEELHLTWNEYYTHTAALFKKGYIKIKDQFISSNKRQILILETFGAEQFNKLTELLHKFLDNAKEYKEYIEMASDKLLDDAKLYPANKED